MSKTISLDQNLLEKFEKKFGREVNPSNFAIFKARAISTEPIKQNTIWNGSKLSTGSLHEIVDIINNTDQNVGVLLMHDTRELNVGRVFHSEVVREDDEVSSVTAYMAILRDDETNSLIAKIENNVLDEVSIGFTSKHARCSECGFDYMSEEATLENWLTETCPNEHTVGEDGCHLILEGIASFREISIVNRGAANKAKILKAEDYSKEDFERFAASGEYPEKFSINLTHKMEKNIMVDKKEAELELSAVEKAEKLELELAEVRKQLDLSAQVEALKVQLSEAEAEVEGLKTEKAEVEAEKAEADKAKEDELEALKTEKEAVEVELSQFKEFIKGEISKVMTASGKTGDVPNDLEGMSTVLTEGQAILASLIPVGGVAQSTMNLSKEKTSSKLESAKLAAFQVKQ